MRAEPEILSAALCDDAPDRLEVRYRTAHRDREWPYGTTYSNGRIRVRLDCLELRPSGKATWALVVLQQDYSGKPLPRSRGTLLRLQNGSVELLESLGVRRVGGKAKPTAEPWRRGTFTVSVPPSGERREVFGYVRGGYGLHKRCNTPYADGSTDTWESPGWVLTHLPSGLAAYSDGSRARLCTFADALEAEVPELAELADPKEGPADVRARYRAVRDRIEAEAAPARRYRSWRHEPFRMAEAQGLGEGP